MTVLLPCLRCVIRAEKISCSSWTTLFFYSSVLLLLASGNSLTLREGRKGDGTAASLSLALLSLWLSPLTTPSRIVFFIPQPLLLSNFALCWVTAGPDTTRLSLLHTQNLTRSVISGLQCGTLLSFAFSPKENLPHNWALPYIHVFTRCS